MRRGQNWVAQDLDGTRSRLSRLKSVPRSLLLTQNHPKSDHFSISHDFGVPPCLFGNLHILYQNPVRVVVAHSWNFPQPNSAPNSPRYAGSCSRQFKTASKGPGIGGSVVDFTKILATKLLGDRQKNWSNQQKTMEFSNKHVDLTSTTVKLTIKNDVLTTRKTILNNKHWDLYVIYDRPLQIGFPWGTD